jgi:hypothetical protein
MTLKNKFLTEMTIFFKFKIINITTIIIQFIILIILINYFLIILIRT